MECTKQLAVGESMLQVPSMYQFEGRHRACMKRFEVSRGSPAVLQASLLCLVCLATLQQLPIPLM
jgi:hypothetical protein